MTTATSDLPAPSEPDNPMLRVKRAVRRLSQKAQGESVTVQFRTGEPAAMAVHAVAFGRNRKVGVRVTRTHEAMTLTRDDQVLVSKYAPLDRLEVGQAHTFTGSFAELHAVRNAATVRAKKLGRRFTCALTDAGMQVTRLADDAPMVRGRPAGSGSTAPARWDLSALEHRLWIELEPAAHQVSSVRQAITSTQIERGWELVSRIKDGKIRIYRLDHPAEGPLAKPAQ